jgi:NAD(P)H-nitrite reductase large subunit
MWFRHGIRDTPYVWPARSAANPSTRAGRESQIIPQTPIPLRKKEDIVSVENYSYRRPGQFRLSERSTGIDSANNKGFDTKAYTILIIATASAPEIGRGKGTSSDPTFILESNTSLIAVRTTISDGF